jgi:hypothetical protein
MAGADAGFVWEIAWDKDAAAAVIDTPNVSDADKPLESVAVTLRDREAAVFGAVPEKVSVTALNDSHEGSAEPFACLAE